MHIESCDKKCFIDLVNLELKRFRMQVLN